MAPWTTEELDRFARERPCRGTMPVTQYGDLGARMPAMRGQVRRWFCEALEHGEKKWFAAAVLRLRPESARRLVSELLRAAVTELDPSLNRAFIAPLAGQVAWPEVERLLMDIAARGGAVERGGLARALYWLKIDLGRCDQATNARLNIWKMRTFLDETDLYAQRSLVPGLSFDAASVVGATDGLLSAVIARARAHEDEYIRHRIEIQLGESRGPFLPLRQE